MAETEPQNPTGSSDGRVTYRVEQQDLLDAYWCNYRVCLRRWRSYRMLAVVGIATFLVLLLLGRDPVRAGLAAGGGVLFGLCFCVVIAVAWVIPRGASRTYSQQRDLQGEVTYAWSAAGLEVIIETRQTRTPWNHFIRWAESDRSFCSTARTRCSASYSSGC